MAAGGDRLVGGKLLVQEEVRTDPVRTFSALNTPTSEPSPAVDLKGLRGADRRPAAPLLPRLQHTRGIGPFALLACVADVVGALDRPSEVPFVGFMSARARQ